LIDRLIDFDKYWPVMSYSSRKHLTVCLRQPSFLYRLMASFLCVDAKNVGSTQKDQEGAEQNVCSRRLVSNISTFTDGRSLDFDVH